MPIKSEATSRQLIDVNVARAIAREFCYDNCYPGRGTGQHHPECVIHIWKVGG